MRVVAFVLMICASLVAACGNDAGPSGEGGSGGAGGGAGATTTSSSTGAGGPGHCGKGCATVKDCCPSMVQNCPGPYPTNFTCDGVCGGGQCASDDDCSFGGVLSGYECVTLDFGGKVQSFCSPGCMTDADCPMGSGLTCSGTDKNGTKYCTSAPMSSTGCKTDADCQGYGACNTASGACECSSDADCTAPGVDTCSK